MQMRPMDADSKLKKKFVVLDYTKTTEDFLRIADMHVIFHENMRVLKSHSTSNNTTSEDTMKTVKEQWHRNHYKMLLQKSCTTSV